jgi:capsular exopolysaccharide synthesis family protein
MSGQSSSVDAAYELGLTDYVNVVRRRWRWLLVPCLASTLTAGLWTTVRAPSYCTASQVLIADSEAQVAVQGSSNAGVANRDLANERNVAQSDPVRARVIDVLGREPDITIDGETGSDILTFRACAQTPQGAADEANAWASAYVDTKQDQAAAVISDAVGDFGRRLAELRLERDEIRQPLDALEDQLAATSDDDRRAALQLDIDRMAKDLDVDLEVIDAQIRTVADNITLLELDQTLAGNGTARVIQQAAVPANPSSGSPARNLTLGLVAGLLLGSVVVLVVDNLDQRIVGPQDIVDLPVLGTVPRPPRSMADHDLALATMNNDGSTVAEGYQKIRSAVEFALIGRQVKSLLITSANPAEGKTTTSCNLAWALSGLEHRVVLADVDFRRPRLHRVFGCNPEPGLSDHLLAGTPLNQLALRVDDDRRNMVIIPTGAQPPNPAEFVAAPTFSSLVRQLEAESDLVVLDAPPILPVSDALAMARLVDTVLLVARAGSTGRQDLVRAAASLRGVGADIVGVCLVGVPDEADPYGYRYGASTEPRSGAGRRLGTGAATGAGRDRSNGWRRTATSEGESVLDLREGDRGSNGASVPVPDRSDDLPVGRRPTTLRSGGPMERPGPTGLGLPDNDH